MRFSNRGLRASGYGLRALLCLLAGLAVAVVVSAQRGSTPIWFEGARLIVGDGNTIDNAAFLVEGEAFTWVG